jgi:hypothetical protein
MTKNDGLEKSLIRAKVTASACPGTPQSDPYPFLPFFSFSCPYPDFRT